MEERVLPVDMLGPESWKCKDKDEEEEEEQEEDKDEEREKDEEKDEIGRVKGVNERR